MGAELSHLRRLVPAWAAGRGHRPGVSLPEAEQPLLRRLALARLHGDRGGGVVSGTAARGPELPSGAHRHLDVA